jgi:hypothetical protein
MQHSYGMHFSKPLLAYKCFVFYVMLAAGAYDLGQRLI